MNKVPEFCCTNETTDWLWCVYSNEGIDCPVKGGSESVCVYLCLMSCGPHTITWHVQNHDLSQVLPRFYSSFYHPRHTSLLPLKYCSITVNFLPSPPTHPATPRAVCQSGGCRLDYWETVCDIVVNTEVDSF